MGFLEPSLIRAKIRREISQKRAHKPTVHSEPNFHAVGPKGDHFCPADMQTRSGNNREAASTPLRTLARDLELPTGFLRARARQMRARPTQGPIFTMGQPGANLANPALVCSGTGAPRQNPGGVSSIFLPSNRNSSRQSGFFLEPKWGVFFLTFFFHTIGPPMVCFWHSGADWWPSVSCTGATNPWKQPGGQSEPSEATWRGQGVDKRAARAKWAWTDRRAPFGHFRFFWQPCSQCTSVPWGPTRQAKSG